MKGVKSYNKWITAGYELFAQEGPGGIQIERLARTLELNKSGFYYYFGTLEIYFDRLMHHHTQLASELVEKVNTMQNFAPDYIHLISECSTPLLVHRQLLCARHRPVFEQTYNQINKLIDKATLPLWAEFVGLTDDHELASHYFDMVRDVFFARLTPHTLSFEFITDQCVEAKEICESMKTLPAAVVNKSE